jgi:hypothetical protein
MDKDRLDKLLTAQEDGLCALAKQQNPTQYDKALAAMAGALNTKDRGKGR